MIGQEIIEISDFLAIKSPNESAFHPINRDFLKPYLQQIFNLDRNSFLLYNIESTSALYSDYLMLSLPELWEDITVNDLIEIINNFKNTLSYCGLISFAYKFVEVNIMKLVLELPSLTKETRKEIRSYIENQYNTFLKSETDFFFFEEGAIGVTNDEWMYIKQKLLLDNRVEPALQNLEDLENYVQSEICV